MDGDDSPGEGKSKCILTCIEILCIFYRMKSAPYPPVKEEPSSAPNKRKTGGGSSTPTTMARTIRGGTSANWSDDPESVPPQLKREGADWFAM